MVLGRYGGFEDATSIWKPRIWKAAGDDGDATERLLVEDDFAAGT